MVNNKPIAKNAYENLPNEYNHILSKIALINTRESLGSLRKRSDILLCTCNLNYKKIYHSYFEMRNRHGEERFVRRSNPVFKPTGLLRLQKAQARNDGAD